MNKFAKLSLVAAVAVAGLSTANAGSLEEAVKNVDVSGSVVYRYNDYGSKEVADAGKDEVKNYYKAVLNLKSKINDDMALNTSIAANNGFSSSDTSTAADAPVAIELTKVNFLYTGLANTSIIVGKQGIHTPFTNGSDTDALEDTGTGVVAMTSVGPVTAAAAYFNQTNLENVKTTAEDGTNLMAVALMAKVSGVSLDAWFADQDKSFDAWTLGAKYSLKLDGAKVSLEARHTSLEVDGATTDNELTILGAKVKAGIFDAKLRYGMGGKDGSTVAFNKYAKAAMVGWNTSLYGQVDTNYLQSSIGVKATDTLHISANYFDVDAPTAGASDSETFAQFTWKPSKNFKTYVRLGELDDGGNKSDVGRLQIQYKF